MSPAERCVEIMRLIDEVLSPEGSAQDRERAHRLNEVNDGPGNGTSTPRG